jgi:hypothetical protein
MSNDKIGNRLSLQADQSSSNLDDPTKAKNRPLTTYIAKEP